MGENGGKTQDSVDRRQLLKGAAAAGIGVAAWAAPGITSLGGTPVYAAACTGGKTTTKAGGRNTSCNCGTGGNQIVAYFAPSSSACAGTPTTLAVFGTACGSPVTSSHICPPAAGFCVTAPAGRFCRVVAIIELGNCGGTFITSAASGIVGPGPATAFVTLPTVMKSQLNLQSCNIFIRYVVECADDDACL